MATNRQLSSGRQQWAYAAIVLTAFLAAVHLVPYAIHTLAPGLSGYGRSAVVKTLQTALPVLAVLLVLRVGLVAALAELGLRASVARGAAIALLATLPMTVAFAVTGGLRGDYSLAFLAVTALFSPVAEEVLFRGYAFGQLHNRAGWGFWPAILVPTLFFSLGHLYQADGLLQGLGIFGVTAIGSVWFAWLYVRWDNLWVPIGLHSLMNLWWYVFAVDTTALGGWLPNIARLATIALSIVITMRFGRARRGDTEQIAAHAPRDMMQV